MKSTMHRESKMQETSSSGFEPRHRTDRARAGRSVRLVLRMVALTGMFVLAAFGARVARAQNTVIQEFYLPMPEQQILPVFGKQRAFTTETTNMTAVVSIVVSEDNTVIFYDQWENGYEANLDSPTNVWSVSNPGGTQIWGDGNDANGVCPGLASDPDGLAAGTVIALRNDLPMPRDSGNTFYDAGDRVGATKAITITRAVWETTRGTVQATAVEVLSTLDHGNYYIAPVGVDVDADGMFEFVDLMVMADEDNTQVVIDPDGVGPLPPFTNTVNRGVQPDATGAFLVEGVSKGATIRSDKNIQVHMITGNDFYSADSTYETRSFVLRPVDLWSSRYIIPIGTANTNYPSVVYVFNTNSSPLQVLVTTRTGSAPVTVTSDLLALTLPLNSGTLLESTNGTPFFAICAMDTAFGGQSGGDFDWGFAPMPFQGLTTEAVCGWGPGSSDLPPVNDGSPVWITPLSATRVYVDYGGDHQGPLTDPKGGKYDVAFDLAALQSQPVYPIDNDATAMRLYTLDGTLIAGAWGEDASRAEIGTPYLDMGYALVPSPVPVFSKTSRLVEDNLPSGLSVGDVLEYTLRVDNRGLLPLGNLVVLDELPTSLLYVTNSTTLDGSMIADHADATPFPLGPPGYVVPLILHGDSSVFKFRCKVVASGTILNTGIAGTLTATNTVVVPPLNTCCRQVYAFKASIKNSNVGTKLDKACNRYFCYKAVENNTLAGYLVVSCSECCRQGPQGGGVLYVYRQGDKAKRLFKVPANLSADVFVAKLNGCKTQPLPVGSSDAEGLLVVMGDGELASFFNVPLDTGNSFLAATGFGKAVTTSSILPGDCVPTTCTTLDSLSGSIVEVLEYSQSPCGIPYEFLCTGAGMPGSYKDQEMQGFNAVSTGTWSIRRSTDKNIVACDESVVEGNILRKLKGYVPVFER